MMISIPPDIGHRLSEVIFGRSDEGTAVVIARIVINVGIIGAMVSFIRFFAGWWFL